MQLNDFWALNLETYRKSRCLYICQDKSLLIFLNPLIFAVKWWFYERISSEWNRKEQQWDHCSEMFGHNLLKSLLP